jgi:hypothetical protein
MPIPEPRPWNMDGARGGHYCEVCGSEVACTGGAVAVRCGRCVRKRLVPPGEQWWSVPRPVPALGDVLAGTGDTSDTGRLEGRPVVAMDELEESDRDDG